MKSVDDQLRRLMKSAASAPTTATGAAKFAMEARVLGAWRGQTRSGDEEFMVAWFRRAAICGCMLAIASLAWNLHSRASQSGVEMTIAGSAMEMGVEP